MQVFLIIVALILIPVILNKSDKYNGPSAKKKTHQIIEEEKKRMYWDEEIEEDLDWDEEER